MAVASAYLSIMRFGIRRTRSTRRM
jgi:hypothetical protein